MVTATLAPLATGVPPSRSAPKFPVRTSAARSVCNTTPVASGASVAVTIDDGAGGCLYDLRAELAGGQTLLRENINVCRIADYYLTR